MCWSSQHNLYFMEFTETLGNDISKLTIDSHLYRANVHNQFPNTISGLRSMLDWVSTYCDVTACLFCAEYTGDYSVPFTRFITSQDLHCSMITGLELKRSIGLKRGKTDAVDAKRIAEYAWHKREDLGQTQALSEGLFQLQKYLKIREHCVKQETSLRVQKKEFLHVFKESENPDFIGLIDALLSNYLSTKKQVERQIIEVINQEQEIKKLYRLLTSIVGVGPVIAWNMLVLTHGFTKFNDSRKFACFAGVAPFPHRSGSSLNYKDRVSPMANKHIKSLINLGARSAIGADPELKAYYKRKQKEGKNNMNILNAVRNKLIHRMFAVVKRGTPYVKLGVIALDKG